MRYREPPFSERDPQLARILDEDPKSPRGNVVRRNIFWAGRGEDLRRVQFGDPPKADWWDSIEARIRPLVKLEDNLIDRDPRFVDCAERQLPTPPADSPAWSVGFQRIPLEAIGLYKSPSRAMWPVRHTVRPLPPPAAPAKHN